MKNSLFKYHSGVTIKSAVLKTITHALLPLALFPFAFFVVPIFAAKANELGFELDKWTLLVFKLAFFICSYWYLYKLILAFAVAIDAVICFSLYKDDSLLH